MKIYTLFTLSLCCLLFLVPCREAQAQLVSFNTANCSYESPCFTASLEEIAETANPNTLTIRLRVFAVSGGTCGQFQNVTFLPSGGNPVVLNANQLRQNDVVVLTVNRDTFLSAPNITITAVSRVRLFGLFNFFRFNFITLRTNLETANPCVRIRPFPVELVSFTGKASARGIALAWRTASEVNNSHFEVERSADGEAFEKINSVAGHGNSSATLDYSYTDASPLPGQNYYRLKQVDFDGQYAYSSVVAVAAAAPSTTSLQIGLAPNPCFNGNCALIVKQPSQTGVTELQLKDLTGKIVFSKTLQHQGSQTLELPMQELQQYKGMFILSATSGGQVVHQRVVLE